MTDSELLQRYTDTASHDAFNQLARRHLDFIYAAALRQTRSTALASDIAQAVLIDLARNAKKLRPDTHLPSWLCIVTRRTAIDFIRRESRRHTREKISAELAAVNASHAPLAPAAASDLAPVLDDALTSLSDSDRQAVLLRFFENHSLKPSRNTSAPPKTPPKNASPAPSKNSAPNSPAAASPPPLLSSPRNSRFTPPPPCPSH